MSRRLLKKPGTTYHYPSIIRGDYNSLRILSRLYTNSVIHVFTFLGPMIYVNNAGWTVESLVESMTVACSTVTQLLDWEMRSRDYTGVTS